MDRCGRNLFATPVCPYRCIVYKPRPNLSEIMKRISAIISVLCLLLTSCSQKEAQWTQLFNGKNLDNWDKFIGPAFEGHEELARNATPDNVFSVVNVDGEKAIRISGEVFGSLATKATYRNFHARMVMKWGKKITKELNCGFLYYGHGPFGAGFGTWKSCVECQLQHGNMGGLYMIGEDINLDAEVEKQGEDYVYKHGGENTRFGKSVERRMIVHGSDAENEVGQWNTIEIYCVGQQTVHVVNGKVTMRTSNMTTTNSGKEEPLAGGCLQLQSEGSELFVKSVEIQPVDKIPADLLK